MRYSQLQIANFRGFSKLVVPGLRRVNLVAGRNNVGKTSLLEAVFLASGWHNPSLPTTVEGMRGRGKFEANPPSMWGWLFHGRKPDPPIEFIARDDSGVSRSVCIRLGEEVAPLLAAGKREGRPPEQASTNGLRAHELVLEARIPGSSNVAKAAIEPDGKLRLTSARDTPEFECVYLASGALLGDDDAARYSVVDSKGRLPEVTDVLHHVDDRIRRLSLAFEAGEPVIKADIGLGILVPIPLVGQGMVRLLKIALSICASAEGGIVLVDEVENGIHHDALDGVWKGIRYMSRKAGVQFFATTHSRECAASAYNAFKTDEPFELGFYRLERVDGEIQVVQYDKEALGTAIESGFEVR